MQVENQYTRWGRFLDDRDIRTIFPLDPTGINVSLSPGQRVELFPNPVYFNQHITPTIDFFLDMYFNAAVPTSTGLNFINEDTKSVFSANWIFSTTFIMSYLPLFCNRFRVEAFNIHASNTLIVSFCPSIRYIRAKEHTGPER